jgi:hypothetical protein
VNRIIDRSPEQKAERLAKIRAELYGLGYVVVSDNALAKLISEAKHVVTKETTS